MKSKTTAALLALFMSMPAWAQMVSHTAPSNTQVIGPNSGQSFTATATTQISRISVRPKSAFNGNLLIYNGSAGSGAIGAMGSPAYSQAGVSLAATTSTGPLRDIALTTPFPVTAGNTYTFILQGTNDFFISPGNPYAGGGILFNYADLTYQSAFDFNFQVWAELPQAITFSSTVPAAAKVGDSYTVTATGGASGNPVVFSIDPSTSAVCSIAGATVSLTGVGTCTINANQAGGNASGTDYSAAPQVQQSFAVAARPLPVATADSYSTAMNTPLTEAAPGVLGNDSSPLALPLTAVLVAGPASGSLTLNSNGSFTYAPSTGFTGTDTFTYSAFDGFGTPPTTVTITVTAPVVPVTPAAPASIPTLSEWGLFALSSLLALFAVGRVRRNQA